MLYLLSTLQGEIHTYNNVIKYIGADKEPNYLFENLVLYQVCNTSDDTPTPYYCAMEGCENVENTTKASMATTYPQCIEVSAFKGDVLNVENNGVILSFAKKPTAKAMITAIADDEEDYELIELVLGEVANEKTSAMKVIYCIMFWVIFALVIATFVLALLSIVHCGCCRCCNIGNSIFPTRQA